VALQLAATAGRDVGDALSYDVDAAAFATPPRVDLSRLRVAWTVDFGVCAVDRAIAETFRGKIAAMRHLFRTCDEVAFDFGEAHRCFDVMRAESFVAQHRDAYAKDPTSLGPNVRANYELGAALTLADCASAHLEQTRIFQRFQTVFQGYDLVLSPTTPISAFPWTELYLKEVNGEPLENYYRWLALTYVVTLVTNPALSLPCGADHRGMPFGLQVIGRFRGDRDLLGAGAALEAAFARIPALQRPRPDLDRLRKPVPALKSIVTHPPRGVTTRPAV
jgi:amidase